MLCEDPAASTGDGAGQLKPTQTRSRHSHAILRRLALTYILLVLVIATVTTLASVRIRDTTDKLVLTGAGLLPLADEIGEMRALVAGSRNYIDAADGRAIPEERLHTLGRGIVQRSERLRNRLANLTQEWGHSPSFPRGAKAHLDLVLGEAPKLPQTKVTKDFVERLERIDGAARRALLITRAELKQMSDRSRKAADSQVKWLVALTTFGCLGVFILSLALVRPLRKLSTLLGAVEALEAGRPVGPLAGGNDEVGAILGAFKRMAEAIRKRETTLDQERAELGRLRSEVENLIESVPQAIVVTDSEGCVTRINQAARSLFQTTPDKMVGQHLGRTPVGPLLPGGATGLEALTAGSGDILAEEIAFGSERILALHGSALRRRSERLLAPPVDGAVLVFEDITRRHQAELGLRRQERLAATGRLAAQVVHEVRNPLSTIGMAAKMLADDLPNDADPEGWLAQIRGEASRLERVTEAYLRLARMPDPHPEAVLLNELVATLVRFLNDDRVRCDVDPELRAFIDPDGLRSVLLNLLQNALHAVDPTAGEVVVRGESARGGHVTLTLTDNGPGIPKHILERLGEPFVKGRPTGTGLGVALAMEILSAQNSKLRISCPKSGGTRCRIDLPKVSG
jgi:PAS domain S-box-containing protein